MSVATKSSIQAPRRIWKAPISKAWWIWLALSILLYGAILAGDDVNASNQPQSDNFGGSINFSYDVCALNRLGGTTPPQLLATHEIMY